MTNGRETHRCCNIMDLQLMELAKRTFSRTFVCWRARCIERDVSLSTTEESS